MRRLGGMALVAALMLTAGCGSGDASGGSSAASPSERSENGKRYDQLVKEQEAKEAAAKRPASVRQYASIISRSSDFRDHLVTMTDCDWTGQGPLDFEPGLLTCSAGTLTMSYGAQALRQNLVNAATPDAKGFVGQPPAEIKALVGETRSNALKLGRSAIKVSDAKCTQSSAGQCSGLRVRTWLQLKQMQSTLDAWQPYL